MTADISKAFHRIIVNEQDRDYLKFLWFNLETEEQRTFRFRVVMLGATCSPYHHIYYKKHYKHTCLRTWQVANLVTNSM